MYTAPHLVSMAKRNAATGEAATVTRTVAYVRVSTEKQADRGVSLDAQEAKLRAYAQLYGLDLLEVIVDAGVSAKSLDRPGLGRALGMLRSGQADALLVVKLDRLTRSVRDLGELVEDYFADPNGPALLSVAEQIDTRSAAGRLVLNVLGAVSQWEREAIGERTSAAMRHMAEQGAYTGGRAPFGYRLEAGSLVEDEAEQEAIRAAQNARASGLSLRAVAGHLEAAGYRTRNGRGFAPVQIARMLAA
ncbi:MAG: recombinase family protein [Vicinamibacteria bacterium]|nr:recombinase family protein [Vicinamibacteria bacterium]